MRSCHCVYCVYSACTSWNPLHKCKVSTNYINMVLFDSFSGTDQETVEPQNYFSFLYAHIRDNRCENHATYAKTNRNYRFWTIASVRTVYTDGCFRHLGDMTIYL